MANTQTTVPLFVANTVLTANQQNLSAGTGVPVFATTVTRDAAFGGSNKALAAGQLCYLESTAVVQQYNGTAWATVGPSTAGALVRVGGGTLSGTSTAFASVFSATYDAYKIIISNGATSASASVTMILGATTSGYSYSSMAKNFADNTSNDGGGAASAAASWAFVAASATATFGFQLDLFNPFLANRTQYMSSPVMLTGNNAAGVGMGYLNNTTSYTGFTLAASSGNLTGTCNIYGYSLS